MLRKSFSKLFSISFGWIIVACGGITLCFIVANLALLGLRRHPAKTRMHVHESDSTRGRQTLQQYGCGGCHVVPGVRTATGRVGPKLDGMSQQTFIAGILPNTPENMVRWLKVPEEVHPGTAMPNLGLTEQEARDIAAYLYEISE